jgi:cobalamin biosynthesis protein CobT
MDPEFFQIANILAATLERRTLEVTVLGPTLSWECGRRVVAERTGLLSERTKGRP